MQGDYLDNELEHAFITSAGIHACTYKTISKEGKLLGSEGRIHLTDTPGLEEGEAADSVHIVDMIKHLKNNLKYVNMFLFTVNGQEPRFDKGTKLLIKTFEQSLGENFWKHVAVVYTRWGNSDEQKRNRIRGGLTEENRAAEVINMLNKDHPSSKNHQIGVYFTDTYEITEEKNDPTSDVLRTIWTVASTKENFICGDI